MFDNNKSLYFTLLGQKSKNTNLLDEKFEADMKAEMQQFKHIFHPIRLAIMQLLHISSKSSSIEIRNRLDLSMSDYYNSVRSLEKLNFVKVFDDFDENGLTKQFVIMEENGKRVYTKFIKLVGKYVDLAKDFIPDFDDDTLYPDS